MNKLDRILCATDFSPCAVGALQQAVLVAEMSRAQIDLVHVAPAPFYVPSDMGAFMGQPKDRALRDIALEEAAKALQASIAELASDSAAMVTPHARYGAPADALAELVEEQHSDLVVLGTTGRPKLSRYILGGVANKVVRRMSCPVLCVPDDKAWPLKKFLVASDFSECSTAALDTAAFLAKICGAEITLAHATPSAWSLPPVVMQAGVQQTTSWLQLLEREAREQLDAYTEKQVRKGTSIADTALLVGSPAHSLLEHAQAGAYDLVVLGTHGRSGVARIMMGSVAEAVVHHCSVPVLTVRG